MTRALEAPHNHRVLTRPPTEEVEAWDDTWAHATDTHSGFWSRDGADEGLDMRQSTTFVDDFDDEPTSPTLLTERMYTERPHGEATQVVEPPRKRSGLLGRLMKLPSWW